MNDQKKKFSSSFGALGWLVLFFVRREKRDIRFWWISSQHSTVKRKGKAVWHFLKQTRVGHLSQHNNVSISPPSGLHTYVLAHIICEYAFICITQSKYNLVRIFVATLFPLLPGNGYKALSLINSLQPNNANPFMHSPILMSQSFLHRASGFSGFD